MNLQTKSARLPEWVMNKNGKLYLAESLLNEIEYLHRKVGPIEWCGPLIFEHLGGDLVQPETLEIRAHHVYPMDIGSAAHTSAQFDAEDIVNIYETHPELMTGHRQGLIHTHHTMSTFFSGTDMDELHENTANHNYYLSLIVNFDGKWMAKVAFIATLKEEKNQIFIFKNSADQEATFGNEDTSEKQVLMMINMDIIKEAPDSLSQEFQARFQELQEKQAKRRATTVYHGGGSTYYGPSAIKPTVKGQEESTWDGGTTYKGKESMGQGELWKDIQDIPKDPTFQTRAGGRDFGQDGDDLSWYDTYYSQQKGKEETKESKKENKTLEGKIDRMTETHAALTSIEWLNDGVLTEMQMRPGKFTTVKDALDFFESYFGNSFGDADYSYWLGCMQKSLYELCKDYAVKLVEVKLGNIFDTFSSNYRVAADLYKIADNADEVFKQIRKNHRVTHHGY